VTSGFTAAELAVVRRAYARQLLALVGDDPRLERAFAQTPREAFLGPGPWMIKRDGFADYEAVPAEPALAYQNVLIGLKPHKGVNNGMPWLHAHWLHAAQVAAGERVVHIGAGAGYYTAILSRLVGARGRVTAIEFDPDLAETARANLAGYRNVTLRQGDGADWPREPCDVVYVNFAVDRPAAPWLERLRPGGRLLFPLGTISRGPGQRVHGAGLRVTRTGDGAVFAARSLGAAFFIRAEGAGALLAEGDEREAMLAAFEKGGEVRSLRWRAPPSGDHALFVGAGWSLGGDEP
jgi:protein-L-isoaspartate(D-aspartate) O-methyltransferase